VKSQTIGTAVSSFTVSDAFSSQYNAYKVQVTGGVASASPYLLLRLGSTTSQYYQTRISLLFSGSTNFGTDNNTTQWTVGGRATDGAISVNFEIINPFLSQHTLINGVAIEANAAEVIQGVQKSTTSFTAFTMTTSTGTLTGGTVSIYGYRKA
jgi:hypothetical protein